MNIDWRTQLAGLTRQALDLYDRAQFDEAITLARQIRQLAQKELGRFHPDFATSCHNLAIMSRATANYTEAISLFQDAIELRRSVLGPRHPLVAQSLSSLGDVYGKLGRFPEAEALVLEAVELLRLAVGGHNTQYATAINNLALVLRMQGKYKQVEPLYRDAMLVYRDTIGEAHPHFAQVLNNLSDLYITMGRYADAEQLLRQAVEARRRALGDQHPMLAQSLNNLAQLFRILGDYAKAELLYMEAERIYRTLSWHTHPDLAVTLHNISELYREMGRFGKALGLMQQAVEIHIASVGAASTTRMMNNLANLYFEIGDCQKAESILRDVLRTTADALGDRHDSYATVLGNLCGVMVARGNYNEAESGLHRATEILRKTVGEAHPEYAQRVRDLAAIDLDLARYDSANDGYRQAIDLARIALGPHHPKIAVYLSELAIACAAKNRGSDAFDVARLAAQIDRRTLSNVFSFGSENDRMTFLGTIRPRFDVFLSLVWQEHGKVLSAAKDGLDFVLQRKAIAADALANVRDTLRDRYQDLRPMLDELINLQRQIMRKQLDGPGPEGFDLHHRLVAEWTAKREQLESDLARQIPEMNLERKLQAADRRAVALALPEGVALVEYVRFDVVDFKAVAMKISKSEWLRPKRWQPARYLAFVLPAGEPDHVQMIDLGEAEPIDRMIGDFRAGITGDAETRSGRDLGAATVGPAPDSSHGPDLRAAVFDKLVPALVGCKRLLLAPDGDLTRLPFEVLPSAEGRCVIDEYAISYVSCGRDVLRFGAASNLPPAEPVVAADPDFDFGNVGSPAAAPTDMSHGRCSRDLDRGLRFGRLKGTRLEGERIAARLGVKPWLDATALESRLKACRSPRILHLATHGFFLADQKRDPNKEFRDLGALPGQEAAGLGRLSGAGLENPLLRSGLALAGANTWLQNGNPPAEAEDGLLTAEDVSGLDLLDTDLVVLSACETGLGEVHIGEGVFGLRRAFVLAGAKTLVMSLWKVPDQQTQELMEDFYRRLLERQPRAEALRQAQLALKARYPNPLYWGAFICQGDPAPLPQYGRPANGERTSPKSLQTPTPDPADSKIRWSCPECGKLLRGEGKLLGKKVKCPKCDKVHAVSDSAK